MDYKDLLMLLQCDNCKENLEAFIREKAVTREQEELLAQFALFCEVRRLKAAQVQQISWPSNNQFGGIRYLKEPADPRDMVVTC
jgi:hypothetical protein